MGTIRHRGAAVVSALAIAVSGVVISSAAPAAAVEPVPLGSESYAAAGSCWEIKQQDPSAVDGAYWLLTSQMPAPQQFYCDMTTDGGGWVLVGKGRNGWTEDQLGTGDEAELTDTSFDGFQSTHQLPAERIDQLLDGGAVADLADPIRIRRATDTAGTTWQEGRFKTRLVGEGLWTWSFGGGLPLQWFGFDGSQTNTNSSTANFGNDNSLLRVDTRREDRTGWDFGFAYGSGVTGTLEPDSYLHDAGDPGWALPFTLMFLRPQVTSGTGFSQIPDTGTPAFERRLLPRSDVDPMPWGVTGIAGSLPGEGSVEVQAFAESNGRMYVGGNFRWVQRDVNGTGRVEQSFLAAFDVNTGEWVSSFRPQLNDQVRALEVLPSGSIVAGGLFSTANGQPATAVVALNPITGATDTSFDLTIENRLSSGVLRVEALSRIGGDLYLGGAFTHLRGGPRTSFAYMRNAARVSAVDGTTNSGWNPDLDGTVLAVDAEADAARMYAAGFFSNAGGVPALKAAAVLTAPGAGLADPLWAPVWSSSSGDNFYQRAIRSQGEQVWVGGSEHSMFSFSTTTFAREYTSIMNPKGDLQGIEIDPTGVAFGGCHCNSFSYEGAANWPNPTGWFAVYSMGWMGAWDNVTGERLPDFVPRMTTRLGSGVWAIESDSNGRLWAGGDIVSARSTNSPGRWTGGFVRFSPSDASAPATPTGFGGSDDGAGLVTLSWNAVSDPSGVVYHVMRGDRPIAVTTATSVIVPEGDSQRYFLRAADNAGNFSASTSVLEIGEPPADTTAPSVPVNVSVSGVSDVSVSLVWDASTDDTAVTGYRVFRDGVEVDTTATAEFTDTGLVAETTYAYTVSAFDAAANESAQSTPPVEATTDATPDTTAPSVPVNVSVSGVSDVSVSLVWDASTDDTAVTGYRVFRDGVEVDTTATAEFTDTGLVAETTYAYTVSAFDAAANESAQSTPPVEATTDATPDTTAPSVPVNVSVSGVSDVSVSLVWDASTDDTAVTGYRVFRDGVEVDTTATAEFTDTGLVAETTYAYTVSAFDAAANESAQSTPPVEATTDPVVPPGPALFDFDGDGAADRAVFRGSVGGWYIDGQATRFIGLASDQPVPADYDGDGATDAAVFRDGEWFIDGQAARFLGAPGDTPVPGDYDGDGAAEVAVYRDGVWYVEGEADEFWGSPGDIPVPADYDGDGTVDRAVYRPSVGGWYVQGQAPQFYGLGTDVPVPADYDGDGAADLAVYRPEVGGWYVFGMETQFIGLSIDVPVPADYDGDGAAERAVYRPEFGGWYVEGEVDPVLRVGL